MKWKMAILIFLLTASAFCDDEVTESTLTKVGQTVPEFSITTLDGKKYSTKELKGKIVLVNFFATWCGPCNAELSRVETDIWKKYKSGGLIILAIGREHTKEELVKFAKKKKFTFPIAADMEKKVYSLFATKFIPRTYLIDRNGKIIYQSVGFDEQGFGKMLETIRKGLVNK